MAKKQERVKLQASVNKELADKIDELAGKMKMTHSDFIESVLEENIRSEEFMVNLVTSRFMAPVRQVVRAWTKKKGEK